MGDLVLRRLADTLSGSLRPTDLLARLGGEEFAVLLPGTELLEAVETAERLRVLAATMCFETSLGELTITVSMGCAAAVSGEDILSAADKALYVAKRSGRNSVRAAARASLAV
jgi:diguanylate cyclase (GGDEF)-like protein